MTIELNDNLDINLHQIPVQDIVQFSHHLKECQGYKEYSDENGVYGMGGRLNIRPPYQREFVYKDAQRNAVIDTITKNRPLSTLYWTINKDGSYEVLDGQQRLISIGKYVNGDFSINGMFFYNLTDDQREQILNYKLLVFFCEGKDSEKLAWFKTINIAGEKLTNQELRNAIYTGPWLSDAKRYFSRTGCPAQQIGSDYVKGSPIRQEYLETVLKAISGNDIEGYMSVHQHDKDATELWNYFEESILWFQKIFPKYREEMKGLPIGELYNDFGRKELNPEELEERISELMQDEDVTKKSGIYLYVLNGNEKHLHIREFSPKQRREAYERQKGICPHCTGENKDKVWDIKEMDADHIIPWSKGGKTVSENCQMLCLHCNRTKSDK